MMPYKNINRRVEYSRNWRKEAVEKRLCRRCGIKLLEDEGKCCCNCSSKINRNLISIARGHYENLTTNQTT